MTRMIFTQKEPSLLCKGNEIHTRGLSSCMVESLPVRRVRTQSPTCSDCQSDAVGLRSLRYVVCLLLMMFVGVNTAWGQTYKYVYVANDNYMTHCGNVDLSADYKLTSSTVFNPNTCIWTSTSPTANSYIRAYGTESHSEGYSIKTIAETGKTYYNIGVNVNGSVTRQFQNAYSEPKCWPKTRIEGKTGSPAHFMRYYNDEWILTEKDNNLTVYNASTALTVKKVTKISSYTNAPMLHINCPDVIDENGVTPTLTASQSEKEYIHTLLDGTENHYWYDGTDNSTAPTITPLTYELATWSLASADQDYASVDESTGTITVKKQIDTDITLTLSCSATVGGNTLNKKLVIMVKHLGKRSISFHL